MRSAPGYEALFVTRLLQTTFCDPPFATHLLQTGPQGPPTLARRFGAGDAPYMIPRPVGTLD